VRRRYWKCNCSIGGSYAADAIVGVDGRFSRVVQKHACRLAAETAFGKTRVHLKEMLGVRICANTVRTMVEGHGKAMARFQPQDTASEAAFRQAEGEVEFTVDAGKVNTREEGWKDLKIAVIQKRKAGLPVSPSEGKKKQRLPAATFTLAFAMIASISVFRRSWGRRLRRLGVDCFGAVYVLADGARWIWKAVQRVLTGCMETLDYYHACQHVNKAAQRIFGKETDEAKAAFKRGRWLLLSQGWKGICVWAGELMSVSDSAECERRRPSIERLFGYFSKHINRLNYAERLQTGRAIGSGVVEGQAKTIGLRLKSRGARWKIANVRPMASLVCVRHSDQWQAYWAQAA
jgi:hypothetical protein